MTSLAVAKSFAVQKWGEYAYNYDALLALAPYRRMMWEVVQEVIAGDQETILDASCGTGNFEHILCGVVGKPIKKIIGVDSSHEMLDAAKDKNAGIEQVTFLGTDLNKKLLFKDNAFTQVVSINTLYAVESPEFTLSEFHRVLKPGGKLLHVTPKHGYENG
jgi:ubiquinone/menaquinone biosynthesis C-methylase UbiE